MRFFAGLTMVALGVACSATARSPFGGGDDGGTSTVASGTGDAGGLGGTGGIGGAGGESAAESSTSSSASSASSSAASTGAGGDGSGGGGFVCPKGTVICEGNVAKVCDGKGGYSTAQDCGSQVCAPNVGCATCIPGSAKCAVHKSIVCNNDGTTTTETFCDPLQGMACSPDTGTCTGACTKENLGQSYYGCDYYPVSTANIVSKSFDFAVAVANTTAQAANMTVTRGATTVTPATVPANSVKIVTLPWVNELAGVTAQTLLVADGAYRLRTDRPVTVYQYNPLQYAKPSAGSSYTNDASLLLPVNAWGTSYRVIARNTWTYFGSPYAGLYAVVASQDNTKVTVTPSATGGFVYAGGGIAANGTGTVTLNEGDVIQVLSSGSTASDVTGTLISADKPVELIGGHVCTFVPHNVSYCDHLEESIPPIDTLATDYLVTAPFITANVVKVRMVRIVATKDTTNLVYDPPQPGAPTSLALAGNYVEVALTSADFSIKADKPVLVAEYMTGQDQGGGQGDPAMAIAVPTAQFRTSYLIHAPTNYSTNFVNIVAPTAASVTLDGQPVATFQTIGNSGYRVARIALSNAGDGNHTVNSSLPCGVTVYGYGQYTSYWYPGGLDLTPLGF